MQCYFVTNSKGPNFNNDANAKRLEVIACSLYFHVSGKQAAYEPPVQPGTKLSIRHWPSAHSHMAV